MRPWWGFATVVSVSDSATLREQLDYYRARAAEYDRWWLREGRFDRGAEANARWFREAATLEEIVAAFAPRGEVLELACGTGLWTRHLVGYADRVTAVDAAPEVLVINRARLASTTGPAGIRRGAPASASARIPATASARISATGLARIHAADVRYVEADLFSWSPEPAAGYDACVFAFWLSHVPEARFARFWETVAAALKPSGRVLFIDSARTERSTAADHRLPQGDEETMTRRLDDGREFRIVKRFYEPAALRSRLAELGWESEIATTGEFFLYGTASRR